MATATKKLDVAALMADVKSGKISEGQLAGMLKTVKPVTITVGEYNGFTTFSLAGNFKPVRYGMGTFRKIVEHIDLVRKAIAAVDSGKSEPGDVIEA